MKTAKLGDLTVSRIGLGAMGMSFAFTGAGSDDAESIRTIHRALDLGVNFIDTAEVYGPYVNEELVGKAIKGRRDDVVLATKFGMISHTGRGQGQLDSSPASIRTAVEGSLQRLDTDRIDLYYQHRVDPNDPDRGHHRRRRRTDRRGQGPPHRAVGGVGRHDPPRARRAPDHRAAVGVLAVDPRPGARGAAAAARTRHRLRAVLPARQGLPHRHHPLDRPVRRRPTSAPPTRASPARTSSATSRIADEVQAVAADAGVTPAQVALAWLLAKGDDIAPIPGTRRVVPARGERRRRRRRADRRPDEATGRPHAGGGWSPHRGADGDDRALRSQSSSSGQRGGHICHISTRWRGVMPAEMRYHVRPIRDRFDDRSDSGSLRMWPMRPRGRWSQIVARPRASRNRESGMGIRAVAWSASMYP